MQPANSSFLKTFSSNKSHTRKQELKNVKKAVHTNKARQQTYVSQISADEE
ncbi:hypothetical protein [Halioxenophilus aromaticivorans]|uniref:Uncharacterized protein n=1 Tax=Halioxenophilus aromaticivorans TaxID=1306992 RepID=A0AAV3U2E3_9ALTE